MNIKERQIKIIKHYGVDHQLNILAEEAAELMCREHHTEAHSVGVDSFKAKYHVYGILYKGES